MLEAVRRFVEVPSIDPDDERRAINLNVLIFGLSIFDVLAIFLVSGFMIAKVEGWQGLISTFWSALTFLVVMIVLYWVNRRGHVLLASSLFVLTLTIAITTASVETVGSGETQFYFMIPVLIASVLIRPFASFIMAAFNSLIFIVAASVFNLEPDFYISITGMFVIAFISWLSARSLENALRDLRVINLELDQRVAQRTKELADANVQLEQQTRELAEANELLQELDHLKSKFISDVSHELRTPINNLSIYLEMLESGDTEKHRRYLDVLREESSRLEDLVADVLDLSRLEAGITSSAFKWIDLNEVVERVVVANRLRAETKGLELIFEPEDGLPEVLIDRKLINQALNNLIANAINYTSNGHVKAKTHCHPEEYLAVLEISDTGMGIPSEDFQHIFKRFYRGKHASQSNIPGTGLGLSIAQEIIDKHGGSIELQSEVGVGSTFTVCLPVTTDDGAD